MPRQMTREETLEAMRRAAMAGPGLLDPEPPMPSLMGQPSFPTRQPDAMTVPTGPAPQRSIWDRIKTGAGSLLGVPQDGLLSPEDRGAATDSGLMAAGISLLGSSGYRTERDRLSLSEALGGALQAGQEGAMAGVGRQDALRARQVSMGRAGALADIQARFVGKDPAAYARALALAGFQDEAKKVADTVKALAPDEGQRLIATDLGDRTEYRHPVTGELVKTTQNGVDPAKAAEAHGKQFTQAHELKGRFLTQTATHLQVAEAYRRLRGAGDDPSPAGDIGLLTAYMKIIDPASSVREGEFATAATAGSVPQRIWGEYNKIVNGQRLTQGQRDDFLRQAGNLARATKESLGEVLKDYRRQATVAGLNPDNVAYDYFSGFKIPDTKGGPTPDEPPPVVEPKTDALTGYLK